MGERSTSETGAYRGLTGAMTDPVRRVKLTRLGLIVGTSS